MINVNDTVKNLYSQDSKHISLFIQLGETTLTNSDFHVESMVLDEVLMAEDQLTFGGCNASRFEITLINPDVAIEKGSVIKPYLVIDGSTTKIWLGEFNVIEIIQAKDSLFRGIIALDHMFKFSTFVTEWYNGLTFPMTLKAFRDSLCNHLGITQNTTTLPFDSLTINKYYENEEVNAVELIRNICELNGRFGKMDRNGKLSYIALSSVIVDSLDVTNQLKSQPTYFSFVTNAIDGVKVVDSDGTFYRKPNEAENAYCFTNNRLLYGRTKSELDTIITKLMDNVHIDAVTYQPTSELKIKGMPYLETGDKVHFTSKGTNIYTYVFKRQIRGIQALTDTIRSEGNLDLQYNDNSILNQLANLNRSDERMKVEISSTAEGLQTEITRATQEEGKLSSSITANANSISAEVTRATTEEGKLSSSINAQAGEIALAVKKGTSYNGMKITDSGMEIKGDGALTVDMSNFKLDNRGNVTMGGNLTFDKNLYAKYNDSENPYSFTTVFSDKNMGLSLINFNLPQVDDSQGVLTLVENTEDNTRAVTIGYNTIFDAEAYGNTSNFYDANISHKAKLPTDTTLGKVNLGNGTLIDPQSEGLGDGTIIGTLNDTAMKVLDVEKETDTRLDTLAYGEIGGKNLLNPALNTKIINGVTITRNKDNTFTLNGTATSTIFTNLLSENLILENGKQYKLLGGVSSAILLRPFGESALYADEGKGSIFTYDSNQTTYLFCLRIQSGTVCNNVIIKPMITTDLTASIDDYEPYIPYSVKTLGNKADDLKMLGWTVPVECPVQNSYSNNSSTQRVGRLDLSSIDWTYQQNNRSMCFTTKVLDNLLSKAVNGIKYKAYCKGYEIVNANYMWSTATNMAISFTSTTPCLRISNNSYTDATAFKNAMKEQNVYLYYELATPVTKNVDGNEVVSLLKDIIQTPYASASVTVTGNGVEVATINITIPSGYKFLTILDAYAVSSGLITTNRFINGNTISLVMKNISANSITSTVYVRYMIIRDF